MHVCFILRIRARRLAPVRHRPASQQLSAKDADLSSGLLSQSIPSLPRGRTLQKDPSSSTAQVDKIAVVSVSARNRISLRQNRGSGAHYHPLNEGVDLLDSSSQIEQIQPPLVADSSPGASRRQEKSPSRGSDAGDGMTGRSLLTGASFASRTATR